MAISPRSRHHYEARARVARAMAHPTRLLLLEALDRKELCVGDLTDLAGVDQSTVSRHLAILKDAALIDGRREGPMTYYRTTCPCLNDFFMCIETILRRNLKLQRAAVGG